MPSIISTHPPKYETLSLKYSFNFPPIFTPNKTKIKFTINVKIKHMGIFDMEYERVIPAQNVSRESISPIKSASVILRLLEPSKSAFDSSR